MSMSSLNDKAIDDRPVIVLGSGGHAAVVISTLHRLGAQILGATSRNDRVGVEILGVRVIGDDQEIFRQKSTEFTIANGIGMPIVERSTRQVCAEKMRKKGYSFRAVVDPTAVIAHEVRLAEGIQILSGAIIQPRVSIGRDTIVNTGARIDHDCEIGINCHVCPGTILAGHVQVGQGSIIGAGTTVIPGVKIGAGSLIAAGSVIFKDVPSGSRIIQKRINLPSNQKT